MMKNHSSSAILLPERVSSLLKSVVFTVVLLCAGLTASLGAVITSFAPASGPVGTLITVKGTSLQGATIVNIGGVPAIIISKESTVLVAMVMPGAVTGAVSVTLTTVTLTAPANFTVTATPYPTAQQGRKIAGATPTQHSSIQGIYHYNAKAVALSADGNTAIVSGQDVSGAGAAIYIRQNGLWQKASPFIISESSAQGISVAMSADGSTAVIGGITYSPVPVLVLRKVNGSWSQPLVEHLPNAAYDPNAYPQEGHPFITGSVVSVTADGKTIVAGSGVHESSYSRQFRLYGEGVSIFNRGSEGWKQAPTPYPSRQYLGTPKSEGSAVPDIGAAISADGKTMALIATSHFYKTGPTMHSGFVTKPYTIIFARATKTSNSWVPQQLLGVFSRVQLSADGNTLLATNDVEQQNDINIPGTGSTHIYTRNGSNWSLAQDINEDGEAVLSADASTLLIANNATVYTRVGGSYVKKVELKPDYYATSAALSADGSTALAGNPDDSGTFSSGSFTGAAYAFSASQSSVGIQATNLNIYTGLTSVTGTTLGLSWAKGSGIGRAVFMKQTAVVDEPAPDDRYFKPKTQFKAGDQVGTSGWYCVYNGTGTNTDVQGLVAKATYRIAVLEYLGTESKPNYLPVAPLLGVATPQIGPPLTQASNLVLSNRKASFDDINWMSSATLSWTNGSGNSRAVFIKGTTTEQPTLADLLKAGNTPKTYDYNYDGWKCVYNGTGSTVNLTELYPGSGFTVAVLEYNDGPDDAKYLFPPAIKTFTAALFYRPVQNYHRTEINVTDATIAWQGAGTRLADEPSFGSAVFVKIGYSGNEEPLPANVYYSPNTKFGSGSQIGTSGWFCVYNGPTQWLDNLSVKITGLTTGTLYKVALVSYSGPANAPVYIQGVASTTVQTTLVAPTGYATGLAFSNTAATSTTLRWVNSNGMARAVFLKLGTSGALNVEQGYSYEPNSTFGAGSMAGTNGWYCVYNGTGNSVNLVGLNPASTYRAIVLEYNHYNINGFTGGEMYNLTRYNGANVTTTANANRLAASINNIGIAPDNIGGPVVANNILSPNGDGKNDTWIVNNLEFHPNNTVSVVDGGGNTVFSKKGYANDWAGTYKGDVLKEGTYYYTIDLGNSSILKGFFTVVRDK